MGSPFTDEEKRFLLAEMIKANGLDVEAIRKFVKANVVEPNWMQMQLPLGRNMNQCLDAADHMGFQRRVWPKRRMSDDQSEPAAKRIALPGKPEPPAMIAALPSTASTHVTILPRPASSSTEMPSIPTPPVPPSTAPKKKGRPARADKARFRPILPQHIAPRPFEQRQHSPHSPHSQHNQISQQSQAPAAPRTNLPPGPPGQDSTANPPASNYSTFYAGPAAGRRSLLRGGTPVDEAAHPRVMAEPAFEHFESSRPMTLPGPVPMEPEPRASSSLSGGPPEELTILPPLLEADSKPP
ncbi:hypothetical protein G7Z17_g10085 [Cylindrodendrum hubeiense]|uniref:Uncharacterized protein n=1 Tax=Cylindrodendrum hubeiense TaxID=595255 RepID=A0A9P5H079_9HYPO|nr:hypothetical protein G7Z17_g10085 [Cylindrodendrum hubeiense]